MKLTQLAAKPKLVKFSLDDKETVEEYGEPIEFYMYDRQPLDIFLRMAALSGKDNTEMIVVVKDLILDEDGKPVLNNDTLLPSKVMLKVIGAVIEKLGK